MLKKMIVLTMLFIGVLMHAQSMYVISEDLNVRLSPSKYGKKTSVLLKGQRVDVYEIENGWARVTEYYDGYSEGVNGRVARWVYAKNLSTTKPKKKVIKSNSPVAKALEASDDYEKYHESFISRSEQLIKNGTCTIKDFNDQGGWARSTTRGKGVYFTYCGGMRLSNKVYINVITGNFFKIK
jgi:hypothetical protein